MEPHSFTVVVGDRSATARTAYAIALAARELDTRPHERPAFALYTTDDAVADRYAAELALTSRPGLPWSAIVRDWFSLSMAAMSSRHDPHGQQPPDTPRRTVAVFEADLFTHRNAHDSDDDDDACDDNDDWLKAADAADNSAYVRRERDIVTWLDRLVGGDNGAQHPGLHVIVVCRCLNAVFSAARFYGIDRLCPQKVVLLRRHARHGDDGCWLWHDADLCNVPPAVAGAIRSAIDQAPPPSDDDDDADDVLVVQTV